MTSEISAAELADAPLGHAVDWPAAYDPALLYPVARAPQRAALGIATELPFTGADVWTAYELTWLDRRGKPVVAIATLEVPATSPSIVESKSMKLYLASFAQSRFDAPGDVAIAIAHDLEGAAGAPVRVALEQPQHFPGQRLRELDGVDLDLLDVTCGAYDVDPGLLAVRQGHAAETLRTNLFRSVCPVTGQPDMASLQIAYEGPPIDRPGLLRYLVSYRLHAGFHEHCVERIFMDVKARCRARRVTVQARFLRRGGLDINPFRTDAGVRTPANLRTARQ
jgi:7-cyano-7-deazaguanine reductase